ncbi:YdeI/OmpD-associated family protein [Massilia endophytica]|uniref:YdeI/OmpD-associated family protein n=1 Tax=Massilia endophytica TaxID=2899220 RepID=UPI001E316166|nr:YdeI/OmpD-associated family protein [Massilia endophytica]UGQ46424.1 YdeI/OmpD-associated family protein [Massilia endophytica]
MPAKPALPELLFRDAKAWTRWLEKEHASAPGVWMRIAKKEAPEKSVQYPEALEAALCFGWIDGQKKSIDEHYWLQKFTPRAARSIWSKINRDKVEALIAKGLMREAGQREVDRAKADGRWEAAYDSWSAAEVPADLQEALDASPAAKAFFATLNSQNRYAILFRTHTAKKAETRAKRIRDFVAMLERGEKIHP